MNEFNELNQKLQIVIEAEESEEAIGKEAQHADEYATKYHQTKINLSIRAEE